MRVRQAIPLYLSVSLCLVVAPLVGTSVNVFAASTLPVVTVSQGPGYTVTAPPPTAQKSDYVKQIPSPSSLAPLETTDSGNYNSTQDFASWSYADSDQMAVESDITLSDAHKAYFWQPDYLTFNGSLSGWWTGTNPTNATDIYLLPGQSVTATSTVTAVSIPGSVTFSRSANTATLSWPEMTVSDNWNGTYNWVVGSSPAEVTSFGTISTYEENDEITFVFGTTGYGVANGITVNYS